MPHLGPSDGWLGLCTPLGDKRSIEDVSTTRTPSRRARSACKSGPSLERRRARRFTSVTMAGIYRHERYYFFATSKVPFATSLSSESLSASQVPLQPLSVIVHVAVPWMP